MEGHHHCARELQNLFGLIAHMQRNHHLASLRFQRLNFWRKSECLVAPGICCMNSLAELLHLSGLHTFQVNRPHIFINLHQFRRVSQKAARLHQHGELPLWDTFYNSRKK